MRPWSGRWVVELTKLVLATYGRRCHLCGRMGATTADHVVPRSRGGSDALPQPQAGAPVMQQLATGHATR